MNVHVHKDKSEASDLYKQAYKMLRSWCIFSVL